MRHAFAAYLNWVGLFCRYRKSAARLERLLRGFPPAFPFRFGKNVADQPFTDLCDVRVAAKTFENISHNCCWFLPGKCFDRHQVACLAGQKVFGWKGRKIFRRVLDLHGMRLLAGEIDHDLIEEKIPLGHATESPAFV